MKFRDKIALLAETELPLGATSHFVCLACGGGTKKEESLSVTRAEDGAVLFKCHRASCNVSGAARGGKGVATPRPRALRPYTGSLSFLSSGQFTLLNSRFGLVPADMPGIRWSSELGRYMLPVFNKGYQIRGYVARSFDPHVDKKAISYIHVDEPFIGFHYPDAGDFTDTAVLVEDYFSAIKVASAGAVGISLNGVHLPVDAVDELKEFPRVVYALDDGALGQAMKLKTRYEGAFKKSLVWSLGDDLKYETTERIREALLSGKTTFKREPQGSTSLRRDILACPAGQLESSGENCSRDDWGVLRDGSGGQARGEVRAPRARGAKIEQPEASECDSRVY